MCSCTAPGVGHRRGEPSVRCSGAPGISERAHLTNPQVSLSTHVDDVVATVHFEGLDDIVLLGFSYGGMVVTGALEQIADRVRELVYVDAFVPTDGQSAFDLYGTSPPTGIDQEWAIEGLPREFEDPAEAEFHLPRRSKQPIRTLTEPVRLRAPLESYPFGLTYVKALGDPRRTDALDPFYDVADRVRDDPAWRYVEITSNHMIPQNRPRELVDLLLTLA